MPYLTVQDYVRRYGEQETATFTNETRVGPGVVGTVDEPKVEEAINDATDVVNGYVMTRYALPLPSTPRLVASWVAQLAREFLSRRKPSDAITDAADRVRSQLKDLAARKIDLPVPEGGTAPAENANGLAETSGDAAPSTFGRTRMETYMGTFGQGYGVPCWKHGGR
jgi:phage gp36-like protein